MMKNKLLLLAIFLLGVSLRFYGLGDIPSSLNWDEVSWGYNAYSIAETGRDEYGTFTPLSFKAFGDYKQPVYVYLDALSVKIFGLNAFAVRLPSALLGSLTIPFVYLLSRQLFPKYKYSEYLALLSAALFAISPWSIQFSRVAYEANIAVFFVVTGTWLFVKGVREKRAAYLALALCIISISSLTYHSSKIFSPLLVAALFLVNYKFFWGRKKLTIIVCLLYLLLNSMWLIDMRTTARGRSVVFTSQQTQLLEREVKYYPQDEQEVIPINKIIHNRRVVYAKKYLENYLSHFDPGYLFIKGDQARHHAPGMGMIYLVLLPAVIIGLIQLVKADGRGKYILFAWLALAPVASSLAIDAPNASRSLTFLPTWQIVAALGIVTFIAKMKRNKMWIVIFSALLLANFIYYLDQYFLHTNTEHAPYWQHGYKEAVEYAEDLTIPVHFTSSIEQGYIFYLFHTHYPPEKYLENGGSSRISGTCYSIENAYFGKCTLDRDHFSVVAAGKESTGKKVETMYYPDGEAAVEIYHHDVQ